MSITTLCVSFLRSSTCSSRSSHLVGNQPSLGTTAHRTSRRAHLRSNCRRSHPSCFCRRRRRRERTGKHPYYPCHPQGDGRSTNTRFTSRHFGKEFHVSVSTVIRFFKKVQYSKPTKLPEVIGIDEFKGNSGGEKFHGILTDLGERKVIDILKTRYEHDLCDYFKKYDRSNVKYFVSDMYKPYAEIAKYYFPNATYVIDKYHWVRQAIWAFEAVRKEVQKQFSKKHRVYFKKSRYLLLKHRDKLTQAELQQVMIMLDISPALSTAYFLKELLYSILDEKDPDTQKKLFSDWIEEASESEISSFVKCAETYSNWLTPITNSFFCPYTNGFTEGCNNKIKVLKRNAYGLQNFKRFRNRILFMFSHQGRAGA